ncbi:MAG: fibronectin type III domain-containing protein [bacterium]
MKKNRLLFVISFIAVVFVFYSCVDNVVDTNTGSTPTITISSPKSGDSVRVGKNKITYSAADATGGTGLQQFEVFIDGTSNGVYQIKDDGTNPDLYFMIDSVLLHTKVSLYVTVYNKNNVYKTSAVISNLYIKENTDPPDPPTNLSVTKFNETSVVLLWEDNSTTEEYYEIWRSAGTETAYGTQPYKTLPKNSTNYSDYGLVTYVTYFYKVRAKNIYGNSTYSNQASTSGGTSGDSPSNLTGNVLGATKVYLTWNDNSNNENGFKIERKDVNLGTDWVQAGVTSPNSTEFTDQGLSARNTYSYRVGALLTNSVAYSNTITVTTANTDIPGPSSLTANFNYATRKVVVKWNDNTTQESGTKIERKTTSGSYIEVGSVTFDVTTFYDSTYTGGVIYYYRARHTTSEGFYTPYSNEDTTYVPILPPIAPTNLTITEVVAGVSFFLDWNDNSNDETGFEIWRKAQTNGTYELYKTITGHSITLTDLNPGITYYFKVRAYRGSLYSDYSNEVISPLQKPTNLVGTVPTGVVGVDLSWTDNSPNETRFEIERRLTGSLTFTRVGLVGANVTSFSDNTSGLWRGSNYEYRIRAANDITTSEYSEIIQISIPY